MRLSVLRSVCAATLLAAAIAACRELIQAPPDDTAIAFRLAPAAQWSGGVVRLVSDAFFGQPAMVVVGEDTLDPWREGDSTLAVELPNLYSGTYRVLVERADGRSGEDNLVVVGLSGPQTWLSEACCEDYRLSEGIPWPPAALLTYDDVKGGVTLVDLAAATRILVRPLTFESAYHRMRAPGMSYHPKRVVLDLGDTTEAPRAWQLASVVEAGEEIPCADTARASIYYQPQYEVAETSPGACVALVRDAGWGDDFEAPAIWANGATEVFGPDSGLHGATFRVAPGGGYAVPLAGFPRGAFCMHHGWPVFGDAAQLRYTIPEYGSVAGVAFSPNGDSLFVLADLVVCQKDGWSRADEPEWVLDVLRAADGERLQRLQLPEFVNGYDVLLDPVEARVLVAGTVVGEGDETGIALAVIDSGTLEVLARLYHTPAITCPIGALVHGGSHGGVFVASGDGVDSGDCGLQIFHFDLM